MWIFETAWLEEHGRHMLAYETPELFTDRCVAAMPHHLPDNRDVSLLLNLEPFNLVSTLCLRKAFHV